MKIKKRRNPEEKKKKLQAAALKTFNRIGYHDTRIEDIVAEARTGKGTFYLYFADKEAVVHSLFDDFFDKFEKIHLWVTAQLSAASDINEIYETEGSALLKLLQENRPLGLFILREGRAISPAVSARLNEFFKAQQRQAEVSYRKVQKIGLGRKVDPQIAALCVVGGVSHIYSLWLEGHIKQRPTDLVKKILEFYTSALLI